VFCYTAGTEVPATRKTTNAREKTATTTATKMKTKTTTEAETETVAATSTTKTVRTIATIVTIRTTTRATATHKITEDKSQEFSSFTSPFYIMFGPIFKRPYNNKKHLKEQQQNKLL